MKSHQLHDGSVTWRLVSGGAQERGERRESLHDLSLAVAGCRACIQVNRMSSISGSLVRDHERAAGRPVVQKRMCNIKAGSVNVQQLAPTDCKDHYVLYISYSAYRGRRRALCISCVLGQQVAFETRHTPAVTQLTSTVNANNFFVLVERTSRQGFEDELAFSKDPFLCPFLLKEVCFCSPCTRSLQTTEQAEGHIMAFITRNERR